MSSPSDPDTIPSPADEEIARRVAELMALADRPSVPRWKQFEARAFERYAPDMSMAGWTVIPQEPTGERRPSVVSGVQIKPSDYYYEGSLSGFVQNYNHVLELSKAAFSKNVAILLGPCSYNTFAIDIDALDPGIAVRIELIAERTLGRSYLRRVGRAPKVALVYRTKEAVDVPRSRPSMTILDGNGEPTENAVEILGKHAMLTAYGFHHKTGQEIVWTRMQPCEFLAENATTVTPAQIAAFLEALDAEFRIQGGAVRKNRIYTGEYGDAVPTVQVQKPVVRLDRYSDIVVRDGLVVDKRELFLAHLSHRIVRDNTGAALTEEGRAELEAVILHAFSTHALLDGRWSGHRLETEVRSKVANLVRKVETGEIKPRIRGTRLDAKPNVLALCQTHGDDDRRPTKWIEAIRSQSQNFGDKIAWEGVALPMIPEHLRIAESPKEASDAVSDAVTRQISTFIAEARAEDDLAQFDEGKRAASELTRLVTAPTGAGKTVRILDALAAGQKDEPWPVLMLMPSYKNVEEVEIAARERGLRVMVFEGKVRTGELGRPDGCYRWQDVKRMQEAGKNSSPLCAAQDQMDPEKTIFCPAFETCVYQRQKREIERSDLVLAVHNYLTVSIPTELSACRMVIVDESVRSQLIRSHTFDERILRGARNLAFLTKKELEAGKAAGDTGEAIAGDMIEDRAHLVEEILPLLRKGDDVAAYILADPARLKWLESCIAICTRTRESLSLTPHSTSERVTEACSIAEQREIRAEAKFWKIIRERVTFLQADAATELHRQLGMKTNTPKVACGKRDLRIMFFAGSTKEKPGKIRLSWVVEANFVDRPMLLLDASANKKVLSRALQRPLDHTPIDAPRRIRFVHVHGRSLSKSSLLPCPRDSAKASLAKAEALSEVRTQISAICAMHTGGVVGCAPKAVEALVLDGWAAPSNFVMLHYGATRGLNFASGYDAAIAIGVVNPSADQIDAEVAALQYADEEQEEPLDPIGDEARVKGDPEAAWSERVVRIQMRNGSTLLATQRSCPGSLAQIVYDQVRREELLQFVGRLRPIHRHDSPTVYTIGSYVPEGVIVDEVVLQSDLVRFGAPLEAARRHQLPIAVDRPEDVLASELEAGIAFENLVAATPSISRNLIHVRIADRLRYVPVYVSDAVDRMVAEGEAEVVHAPDRTPIIRPLGWVEDVEIHARRDAEYGTWMEALAWADYAGWVQDGPGEDVYLAKRPHERVGLAVVVEALKREIPGFRAEVAREEEAEFEAWLETHPELTE